MSHLMRWWYFSSSVNSLFKRMSSHPVGLDVWFFVRPFVYFHSSCVRTAKALARLRTCTGSPEPLLVACVISTIVSWVGSNKMFNYSTPRSSVSCPGTSLSTSATSDSSQNESDSSPLITKRSLRSKPNIIPRLAVSSDDDKPHTSGKL